MVRNRNLDAIKKMRDERTKLRGGVDTDDKSALQDLVEVPLSSFSSDPEKLDESLVSECEIFSRVR